MHKGGSPCHKANYRPVSVLKYLSSIFEKLVYVRLRVYLDCHKMLCNNQFGFRPGRSTEGALQAAVLSVYGALDSGSVSLDVFLDLSRAFDSLNRDVFIFKLSKYGIINRELAWFKSYLTNRIIRSKWKGELSEPSPVDFGVPQDSTLGPALFLLLYLLMIFIVYVKTLSWCCSLTILIYFCLQTAVIIFLIHLMLNFLTFIDGLF